MFKFSTAPRVLGSAVVLGTFVLTGCASSTPTREITQGYAIFDVKGDISSTQAADAIKLALQQSMTGVQIRNELPPSPLPDKPGRFQMVSPFKAGSSIAVMAAGSGQQIEVPTCEGSVFTANGRDTSYARYAELTTLFVCLMPYRQGYALNVVTSFSKTSGGFSPGMLGVTLARAVVGDSGQMIARTVSSIVDGLKGAGATVELKESYPQP